MSESGLLEAYLATEIHFVDAEGRECKTRSFVEGNRLAHQTTLAQSLAVSFTEAWVITAENPFSNTLGDNANKARNLKLQTMLAGAGFVPIKVRGISPDGKWVESSFLVFAENPEKADVLKNLVHRLATKFEQNAVFQFKGDQQILVGVARPKIQGSRKYGIQFVESSVAGDSRQVIDVSNYNNLSPIQRRALAQKIAGQVLGTNL